MAQISILRRQIDWAYAVRPPDQLGPLNDSQPDYAFVVHVIACRPDDDAHVHERDVLTISDQHDNVQFGQPLLPLVDLYRRNLMGDMSPEDRLDMKIDDLVSLVRSMAWAGEYTRSQRYWTNLGWFRLTRPIHVPPGDSLNVFTRWDSQVTVYLGGTASYQFGE